MNAPSPKKVLFTLTRDRVRGKRVKFVQVTEDAPAPAFPTNARVLAVVYDMKDLGETHAVVRSTVLRKAFLIAGTPSLSPARREQLPVPPGYKTVVIHPPPRGKVAKDAFVHAVVAQFLTSSHHKAFTFARNVADSLTKSEYVAARRYRTRDQGVPLSNMYIPRYERVIKPGKVAVDKYTVVYFCKMSDSTVAAYGQTFPGDKAAEMIDVSTRPPWAEFAEADEETRVTYARFLLRGPWKDARPLLRYVYQIPTHPPKSKSFLPTHLAHLALTGAKHPVTGKGLTPPTVKEKTKYKYEALLVRASYPQEEPSNPFDTLRQENTTRAKGNDMISGDFAKNLQREGVAITRDKGHPIGIKAKKKLTKGLVLGLYPGFFYTAKHHKEYMATLNSVARNDPVRKRYLLKFKGTGGSGENFVVDCFDQVAKNPATATARKDQKWVTAMKLALAKGGTGKEEANLKLVHYSNSQAFVAVMVSKTVEKDETLVLDVRPEEWVKKKDMVAPIPYIDPLYRLKGGHKGVVLYQGELNRAR